MCCCCSRPWENANHAPTQQIWFVHSGFQQCVIYFETFPYNLRNNKRRKKQMNSNTTKIQQAGPSCRFIDKSTRRHAHMHLAAWYLKVLLVFNSGTTKRMVSLRFKRGSRTGINLPSLTQGYTRAWSSAAGPSMINGVSSFEFVHARSTSIAAAWAWLSFIQRRHPCILNVKF